jgi:hypothetical protein
MMDDSEATDMILVGVAVVGSEGVTDMVLLELLVLGVCCKIEEEGITT